ncbi:unnamed protein product [Urochloa humidicola]
MANFHCNPTPYLPPGAHVEDGWQRPARSRVALGGEPPRRHEEYAIVTLHPEPAEEFILEALQDVVDHLEEQFPVRILSRFRSPLGLGLVQFQSATQRQSLIDLSPIPFIHNSTIRVTKHDEASNLRACNYSWFVRLMVLAFPLDYQTMDFFKAAVAPFGRLITWYESANKSRNFLDCLVLSPDRIPRSVVVSQGSLLSGNGRSWTAPVYIIGGQSPDVFPGDEDPVPVDGNPHPVHGHIAHANPDVNPNWLHDLNGVANAVLFDHGVNQNQMQEAVEELAPNQIVEDADDAWPEWDANINVQGQAPQVPQHPDQPQDSISFDQSGSTASYLRANGPDIHLSVEMIRKGQLGSGSSSSSSSEISSLPQVGEGMEGHSMNLSVFWPAFDQPSIWASSNERGSTIEASYNIPAPISLKRNWSAAFERGSSSKSGTEDLSKAIVVYQPVLDAVLLQIWAQKVEDAAGQEESSQEEQLPALSEAPVLQNVSNSVALSEIAEDNMTPNMQGIQPEMQGTTAKKCLQSAFDDVATTTKLAKPGLPPRPPKSVISLPSIVSQNSEAVPLVSSTVRRSPRLNKSADGYKHCQLVNTPRKKRKNIRGKDVASSGQTEAEKVQVLDTLPVTQAEVDGPIPMEVLQDWGIHCGVPPSEVTENLLLQKEKAPTSVLDEDTPTVGPN